MPPQSSFLSDVVYLLEQNGVGIYGSSIFKGTKAVLPSGSGPFITVVATGGQAEEGTHNLSPDQPAYERPSAQITVRAESAAIVEQKINEVYFLFHFVNQFVNGTWWRSCQCKQPPFDLGVDEKNRARWAFNIEAVKRTSPATS